jgi:hypothetical protein
MAVLLLEVIIKMSFGPISLLAPRFKSSTYYSYASGLKRGSVVRVAAASPVEALTKTEAFNRKWNLEPKFYV